MSTRLSVNVNKVAVLRNSRGGGTPDVTRAALTCLEAGAHGITVHPRPDRRHIVAEDLPPLAGLCARFGVEFNIEGNPFAAPRAGYPGLLALCEQVRPAQVTLVPDGDGQLTSDHGFSFEGDTTALALQVAAFADHHLRVSKATAGDGSPQSQVAPIAGAARTQELARMLGGEQITPATLAHAQELLEQARPAPASATHARPAGRRGVRV